MRRAVLIFTLGVFSVTSADAGNKKVAVDLEDRDPLSSATVIIQYTKKPSQKHADKIKQKGGVAQKNIDLIDGILATVPVAVLGELADDSDVARISPDREITGSLDRLLQSIDHTPLAEYLGRTGAGLGSGVAIAYLDSGIDASHPNFKEYGAKGSRIVYSQSLIGGPTKDEYGHGTHVIGIGSGADNVTLKADATREFSGVALDGDIVSLKVLDENGKGTDSGVIAAIERAIQLKSKYNIRVMNLSLGRPVMESYKTDPLCQAVERAWKAGIVVVVAAGNNGRDNSLSQYGATNHFAVPRVTLRRGESSGAEPHTKGVGRNVQDTICWSGCPRGHDRGGSRRYGWRGAGFGHDP